MRDEQFEQVMDGMPSARQVSDRAFRLGLLEAARACEEQGRMSKTLDGQTFYIAAGQCAQAIRALAEGK